MECTILGNTDEDVGVEVMDENGNEHIVEVAWNGEVEHFVDDYPHKREERTEEEQRIMTQVEERARFAAHKEFPDEDILHPMWDPAHIEAGIEAFGNYPREKFLTEFRDFYEAIRDPSQFIDDPRMDPETVTANLSLHFRNGKILDVSDLVFEYKHTDGSEHVLGETRSVPPEEELIVFQPYVEFADDFDYEQQFQGVVLSHLMAQIRDIYLNMGEDPPPEYRVEGIGKINIVGDGVGNL
jgi:hypothetical protein